MRKVLGMLVFGAMLGGTAFAQTHYCDQVQPTTGSAIAGSSVTLSVCSDNKDTNGNTTTITGGALYLNGARSTVSLVPGSVSPTSGKQLFTASLVAPSTKGNFTYEVALINAQSEGAKSTPFVLAVSLPASQPTAPTNLTVK